MKKVISKILMVLTVLLLAPNVTKAESTTPSVSLKPNKSINEGDEVVLEVNYGSAVKDMYFDVEALGFCTLFDCNIKKEDVTIDGKALSSGKRFDIKREDGTRNLQISIADTSDSTTFQTVQIKTKALSIVTKTKIKVLKMRNVSLPSVPSKSASVDIIDEFEFVLKNNGEDVTLSIPRGTTLKSLLESQYYTSEAKNNIKNVMDSEKFAKFVNVETGKDFNVGEPINTKTTVKAVYYISLTIDGKKYDKIFDNAKITDLYKYATAKDGYEFVGYTKDDGTVATDDDVKEGAKFISSYKKVEDVTVSNNVTNPNTLDNTSLYFTIAIVSIIVIGLISKYLLNTVKNK